MDQSEATSIAFHTSPKVDKSFEYVDFNETVFRAHLAGRGLSTEAIDSINIYAGSNYEFLNRNYDPLKGSFAVKIKPNSDPIKVTESISFQTEQFIADSTNKTDYRLNKLHRLASRLGTAGLYSTVLIESYFLKTAGEEDFSSADITVMASSIASTLALLSIAKYAKTRSKNRILRQVELHPPSENFIYFKPKKGK